VLGTRSCRPALALALVLFSIVLLSASSAVAAPQTSCIQDGPANGDFVVELCLTADPAPVASGNVAVSATAAVVSGTNPLTQRMVFYLDGQPLLTDFSSPTYQFMLPTQKWVDGEHLLEVEDMTRYIDPATSTNFVTGRASLTLTFDNGVLVPPVNTNTFTPRTGTAPAPGQPFVLAATGDAASGEPLADAVSDMINGWNPNLFLYLGDVYEDGTYTEFINWYGDGSNRWSRFKNVTNPTIGNHEYAGGTAPGYFDYWDNVPLSYSFDTQGWHFVTVDSNTTLQTLPTSAQYQWLAADLAANTAPCTVAFLHHPRFSIGTQGDTPRLDAMWRLFVDSGVDIVLTGHDHNYQRWVPMDGDGNPSADGPTQFVLGAGGHGIRLFDPARVGDPRVVSKSDDQDTARGALRLVFTATGADYEYVRSSDGGTLDSGSIECAPPPVADDSIVFASSRTGNGDIYKVKPDGSSLTQLTGGNAIDAEPEWSPDRSQVAFTSTRDGNVEIYAMNADGSNVRRLTDNAALDSSPAWSPDGTKIAFVSRRSGGNLDIYVMDAADGANVSRLTSNWAADTSPAWSSDGTRIAFSSLRTGLGDIYTMNADGSGQTRRTSSWAIEIDPAWQGSTIAFSANRHSLFNFDIYTMNEDGSAVTRRTSHGSFDVTPAFSADGTSLVFSSSRSGWIDFDIFTMNADGSGQTALAAHPAIDAFPDW
jgi:dipeptidyl aminopeptidase/acylaminoacyl peptidase